MQMRETFLAFLVFCCTINHFVVLCIREREREGEGKELKSEAVLPLLLVKTSGLCVVWCFDYIRIYYNIFYNSIELLLLIAS